jgi:RNA polymerase sigma factor (sigma-70 family)
MAPPFPATRHSTLARIRGADEAERRRGLQALAEAYWRPVYGYLRLQWRRPHEEAADLAQDLFAQILHKGLLASFDPRRARLRTFLRLCIDSLVAGQDRAARRLKRGGAEQVVSFDAAEARASYERVAAPAESPEALFEKEWARGLFAAALQRLRERCQREGKEQQYQLLEQYELGDERPTYAELARRFDIAATDVTNRLAWARRQLRAAVLDLLREHTASDAEFRDEARALLGVEAP